MRKFLYLLLALAISSFTFIGCISVEDVLPINDIEEVINRGRNLMPADIFIKTYSSPYIKYYKMNWGSDNTSYNNTWYADTGSWFALNSHYDISRHMIYGFSVIE